MKISQVTEDRELLSKIIDSSYDGIFITDDEGKVLYCNEAYTQLSGLHTEELIGKSLKDLLYRDEMPDVCSLEVIQSKKAITKIVDYYNGVSALITSTPVFDEKGDLVRVFSNVRDITQLISLQEQLQKTKALNKEYRQRLHKYEYNSDPDTTFVAKSPVMENLTKLALRIAAVNSPVLIQGESGVGKDVLAKYIHNAGINARYKPFIHVNCGAIPETLWESELFGYEAGAFTGAAKGGKKGLMELADNGTLYLDEIGSMPFSIQVKLLDALQSNAIYHLGGTKKKNLSIRIIAATNSDLEKLIEKKVFREDLYYRLNVIPLYIPPIRERKEDILPLILHFVNVNNLKFGTAKKITPQAVEILSIYGWPGNVRELKNVIERMMVLCEDEVIADECIPKHIKYAAGGKHKYLISSRLNGKDLKAIMEDVEKEIIKDALGNKTSLRKTAKNLGIDLSTLVRKKKKYGL